MRARQHCGSCARSAPCDAASKSRAIKKGSLWVVQGLSLTACVQLHSAGDDSSISKRQRSGFGFDVEWIVWPLAAMKLPGNTQAVPKIRNGHGAEQTAGDALLLGMRSMQVALSSSDVDHFVQLVHDTLMY